MRHRICYRLKCPRPTGAGPPELQDAFGDDYEFSVHLTSLAFHPLAFVGQQAAYLVEREKGAAAKAAFVDQCFAQQDRYKTSHLGDYRKSDVDKIFAAIARDAGVCPSESDTQYFLNHLHDWEEVVKPAYAEHKIALGYGVFGTPKFVVNEQLVPDTESTWGPDEWRKVLAKPTSPAS